MDLLKNIKFQLLLLDTGISLITFVGGRYLLPDDLEIVLGLVAIMQPVFVALITGQAKVEQAAILQSTKLPDEKIRNWVNRGRP